MREILFRGKRVDNGEWVEGTPYQEYVEFWQEWEWFIQTKHPLTNVPYMHVEIDRKTICQFTGLTDKNGKKIFEGDIIKSDNGKQSAVSVVCYGEFSPRMFYDLLENFVMTRPKEKIVGLFLKSTGEEMLLSNNSKLIEVIGNIYDNPELLKEE